MRVIYSFIFDRITDPLGLPIYFLWEYLILAIIGKIGYKIAYSASPGGRFGSEIHWFVRIISYIFLWAITYSVIWIIKLFIAHWKMILNI